MKINVLLVEGRKVTREGLSLLLSKHGDIDVVGEADDPQAAIKLARAVTAHVVVNLVTVFTPEIAEMIRAIAGGRHEAKVIILLRHSDPAVIRSAFEAGASGCLTKECASEELVTAIRTVRSGKTYLSSRVSDAVVSSYVIGRPGRQGAALSAREREILQRLANGETTKEMARHLSVSTKTVETYRRRMMEKLKLRSVAELTKYAVLQGLSSLELHA